MAERRRGRKDVCDGRKSKIFIMIFVVFIFWEGRVSGIAQVLFLALYLGITPGGLRWTHGIPGIKPWLAMYNASTFPRYYLCSSKERDLK